MLDYNKIQQEIVRIIGRTQYDSRLLTIAEMLDRLNPENFPERDGVENFIAKVISDVVLGKRAPKIGKNDVLSGSIHQAIPTSINTAMKLQKQGVKIAGIEDFDIVRPVGTKQHIVNLHERIDKVLEMKKQLEADPKLNLSKMPSGKGNQSMNDWLSDLKGKTLDKESEYLNSIINECFEISKRNYIKSTTTDRIRQSVSHMELVNLDCKSICLKYDLDFGNGSVRKFISRLKKKAQEV